MGDTCIFTCPNKPAQLNETENKEIFTGQRWRFFDKKHGKDRWSYHHHFRCMCKYDLDRNELCWWQPVEPFWINPMACDPEVFDQTYQQRLRLGKIRATPEQIEEEWRRALALKPTFPFPVHMPGGNSVDRKMDSESEFVAENGFPDTEFLNNALSQDDNYLSIVNDIGWLASNADSASHADFRHMAQMKKSQNLIQMLTFLQNDDEQPASRFLDYGCYCAPHTRIQKSMKMN